MKDYLTKAYAFGGTVRIYAAVTTDLVEQARLYHNTWPTATAALGRALTATVIMGAMYKDDQEITIRIDSDGPIGGIVTTANTFGEVRGYVGNPKVYLKYDNGKLNVGAAVGNGYIHVTKNLKVRDIFTSSSAIQTGEVAEDFTYYFAKSEQIPSSVGLGVLVDKDTSVLASGGYILQIMPGCKEETLSRIENILKDIRPISDLISNGYTPEDIINELTKGDHEFLQTLDLKYACNCSREKFEKGLISLGRKELNLILEEDGHAETSCHFCNTKYLFTDEDLKNLIIESK